jgi:DNA-binding CsgD family transcriptional regulator
MSISRATVKTHLAHAFRKLNARNRTELAVITLTRLS